MAVNAQRFKLLDADFNVAVKDFLTADNNGPLNVPSVTKTANATTVNVGPSTFKSVANQRNVLPRGYNELGDKKLNDKLLKNLGLDNNTLNKMTGATDSKMVNSTIETFSKNTIRSPNKYVSGAVAIDSSCNLGILDLLNKLNRISDFDFNLKDYLLTRVALLTSILSKMACNGLSNGYSGLTSIISDDVSGDVGMDHIREGGAIGDPNITMDVASTPYSGKVANSSVNSINVASKPLDNFDLSTVADKSDFINRHNSSLDLVAPGWDDVNKHTLSFAKDSSKNISNTGLVGLLKTEQGMGGGHFDFGLTSPPVTTNLKLMTALSDSSSKLSINAFA